MSENREMWKEIEFKLFEIGYRFVDKNNKEILIYKGID